MEAMKNIASVACSTESSSVGRTRHTFSKKERLCGKKDISNLLSSGKYIISPALRCCCLADNGLPYSRIMISVPKKSFKRAVKRNLLKRRIREAYRLGKGILPDGTGADLLIIYTPKEVLSSAEISSSMGKILSEVSKRLEAIR